MHKSTKYAVGVYIVLALFAFAAGAIQPLEPSDSFATVRTKVNANFSDITNLYVLVGGIGGWTNLSQYNNDSGFIAAEADTLASVLARGSDAGGSNITGVLSLGATRVETEEVRVPAAGYLFLKNLQSSVGVYIYDKDYSVASLKSKIRIMHGISNGVSITDYLAVEQFGVSVDGIVTANHDATGTNELVNYRTVTNLLGTLNPQGFGTGDVSQAYVDAQYKSASAELDYVIPYALTVTVQRVRGWKQGYWPTGPTTILIEDGGTGTMDQVNLALRAFTNSITIGTGNVTFATAVVPGTNAEDITTVLFYSPVWATNWSGSQL